MSRQRHHEELSHQGISKEESLRGLLGPQLPLARSCTPNMLPSNNSRPCLNKHNLSYFHSIRNHYHNYSNKDLYQMGNRRLNRWLMLSHSNSAQRMAIKDHLRATSSIWGTRLTHKEDSKLHIKVRLPGINIHNKVEACLRDNQVKTTLLKRNIRVDIIMAYRARVICIKG